MQIWHSHICLCYAGQTLMCYSFSHQIAFSFKFPPLHQRGHRKASQIAHFLPSMLGWYPSSSQTESTRIPTQWSAIKWMRQLLGCGNDCVLCEKSHSWLTIQPCSIYQESTSWPCFATCMRDFPGPAQNIQQREPKGPWVSRKSQIPLWLWREEPLDFGLTALNSQHPPTCKWASKTASLHSKGNSMG